MSIGERELMERVEISWGSFNWSRMDELTDNPSRYQCFEFLPVLGC